MPEPHIIGWSHLPFGKLDALDLETLVGRATTEALQHAQVDASEIDAIFIGHAGMGLVRENFISSYPHQAEPGLRWCPSTRVENACATGTAKVYQAMAAIEAGTARTVLVIGAEKMTGVTGDAVTAALGNASYVVEEARTGLTFPGIFARFAQGYFERYGDHGSTPARIAAKNHFNGARNPLAHLRRDLALTSATPSRTTRRSPHPCARPIVRWSPTPISPACSTWAARRWSTAYPSWRP